MKSKRAIPWFIAFATFVALTAGSWIQAEAAVRAPISGEIQAISIDNPADHWSSGKITVGGQIVYIPRNLLIDLPANRLTLAELFSEAPAACVAAGETGLAKGDTCNSSGTPGIATISATLTNGGNIVAGDLFIEKGIETVAGTVTFIHHGQGWFRLNGTPGNPRQGVMVRINDPDGRHTVQRGLGCVPGSPNCSPDPRFTLDPDNYTNVFSTGYPLCIPSTRPRAFPGLPGIPGVAAIAAQTTQAAADGTGDLLCPETNRTVSPVLDSRRFAPIRLGDWITAEGNFETIDGVRFLSAHSTTVGLGLVTRTSAGQPDYMFLDEVEMDAPGFNNERVRALIIGFTTLPSDVLLWTLHYDPNTNEPHEFPWATTRGCDAVGGGPGACTQQGLGGNAGFIFKIRYDVDFLAFDPAKKPELYPCSSMRADILTPGFSTACPSGGTFNENFSVLSPMPHEIQARTRRGFETAGLITIDVNGNSATNGQYLFPFGVNLGGIGFPEFVEIDLNRVNEAEIFEGLPWLLDRRLSPGGCIDTSNPPDGIVDCEGVAQPLDPFPFSGLDPRTQAALPAGSYNDPTYTASTLSVTANRIFSYVTQVSGGGFNFDGDNTLVPYPPADPAPLPIRRTPVLGLVCAIPPANVAPVAVNDSSRIMQGVPVIVNVLANDTDANGNINPASVQVTAPVSGGSAVVNGDGTVTYTSPPAFVGADSFTYTVADTPGLTSNVATVNVDVNVETLAVTAAQYETANKRWTVLGTSDIFGPPGNRVSVLLGAGPGGRLIGTAPVALGEFTLRVIRNAAASAPDPANPMINLQSSNGGILLNVPVTILP